MHCYLDLWPFDLKIYRAHPWLMGSLHVKFHDDRCKGKAVMRRKPKCGRTDGRTDGRTWWFQYTPPNFVAGGIITSIQESLLLLTFWVSNIPRYFYFALSSAYTPLKSHISGMNILCILRFATNCTRDDEDTTFDHKIAKFDTRENFCLNGMLKCC